MNPTHSLDTRSLFNDAIPVYHHAKADGRSVVYHYLWDKVFYGSTRPATYRLPNEAKR